MKEDLKDAISSVIDILVYFPNKPTKSDYQFVIARIGHLKKIWDIEQILPSVSTQWLESGWTPTSKNINSLPDPIRDYIHDIEANGDPAGTIQENACLRENVKALTRKCKVLELQIESMK